MLARSSLQLTAAAVVLLAAGGCLEREEKITVNRAGAVRFELKYEGDTSDFTGGDALPSEVTGWAVSDEIKKQGEDGEKTVRNAQMTVAAGDPLPDSFAVPDTPEYDASLRFPTTLTVERRPDGTYYHFRRDYEPREFQRYNVYREMMEDTIADGGIMKKDPQELNDDERAKLVEALRTIEMYKFVEYVQAGVDAVGDEWPQDYGLIVRQAVIDHFQSIDAQPIVALLSEPQSDERDAKINNFAQHWVETTPQIIEAAVAELPGPRDAAAKFQHAFDLERARHDVTDDLQDETWKISVTMPGEIVAHNGDHVDGNTVGWDFPFKMLNDRRESLMVTSRVSRGSRPSTERGDSEPRP